MEAAQVHQSEFSQLKVDPAHVHYHYDHVRKVNNLQWDTFNKTERVLMPGGSESRGTNLYRHDLMPGYVNQKPLSLQK
jgi:hypothetical protein